ncbi:MAG: helix-turn-helix transcriptional regulator [Clostridia bacterium]|nr:helix-turn-helix transcriptional regulator [Clostridia bacterium]
MIIPEIKMKQHGIWKNSKKERDIPTRFALTYEIELNKIPYGKTIINGITYDITDENFFFTRPGDLRSTTVNDGMYTHTEFIYFFTNTSVDHQAFNHILENIPTIIPVVPETLEAWNKLQAKLRAKKNTYQLIQIYLDLWSFILLLYKTSRDTHFEIIPTSNQSKSLFLAIKFMSANLSENLSIEEIAAHVGYSSSYLNYLFKTYTKLTPHAYYTYLKIEEAKRLLQHTSKTVDQISKDLGFAKTSQFINTFKNMCNITPGKYRDKKTTKLYTE